MIADRHTILIPTTGLSLEIDVTHRRLQLQHFVASKCIFATVRVAANVNLAATTESAGAKMGGSISVEKSKLARDKKQNKKKLLLKEAILSIKANLPRDQNSL